MSGENSREETEGNDADELESSGKSSSSSQIRGDNTGNTDSGFDFTSLLDLGSTGNVGIREGISYGLSLIVYIVGLLVITSILSGIGGAFVIASGGVDNIAITALIGLFGFLVSLISLVLFFAGFAGLQYKIIADAVSRGNKIE